MLDVRKFPMNESDIGRFSPATGSMIHQSHGYFFTN